jgi:hypothetical protein
MANEGRFRMSRALWLSALLLVTFSIVARAAQRSEQLAGHLVGSIHSPAGQMLSIDVDLRRRDDKSWDGDISIPAQNAKDLALDAVKVEGDHASFVIHGVAGAPTFDGRFESANKLAGRFTQGG